MLKISVRIFNWDYNIRRIWILEFKIKSNSLFVKKELQLREYRSFSTFFDVFLYRKIPVSSSIYKQSITETRSFSIV